MKNLICLLLAFGELGCQRNVYFNDFEKSLLNIYNEGDTLIFKSERGETDTSYILRKKVDYAEWNPFAHHENYKTLVGVISYGSKKKMFQGDMYRRTVLSLGKNAPDSTFLSVSYDGILASWNFAKFSMSSWYKYKVEEDLYRFKVIRKEEDSISEGQLFFHLRHGIVKYITREGEIWERINIKE